MLPKPRRVRHHSVRFSQQVEREPHTVLDEALPCAARFLLFFFRINYLD